MKTRTFILALAPSALILAGCSDYTTHTQRTATTLPAPTGLREERVYAEPPPEVSEPTKGPAAIVVEPGTTMMTRSDLALADSIRRSLARDDGLAPSIGEVTVSVREGRVTLLGTVKSDLDAKALIEKIERIAGVLNVENALQINPNG